MATVAQLKERAASLLPPGSEVQQAFVCQTAANFVIVVINWLTGLTLGLITYRCVAITGDAIYVFDAPRTPGGANPRSVIATLPGTLNWVQYTDDGVSSLFSASGIGSSNASKIRSPRPTPPQDSVTNGRSAAIPTPTEQTRPSRLLVPSSRPGAQRNRSAVLA
jgi:hypothetical protein